MKFLFDFFPLLLFFAAFKAFDIYIATAVAIAASFAQVGFFWLRHRRFEAMHLVTLGVIVVFGGLTLLLHDDTFIRWKPTLVYWILALLAIGSQYVGRKTLIERMLGGQIGMPADAWRRLNLSWVALFVLLGGANLYVAFFYGVDLDADTRRNIWVNFKVFGLTGLTIVFAVAQAVYMARHMTDAQPADKDVELSKRISD